MNVLKKALNYFSRFELILWGSSVTLIILSYLLFKNGGYLTLAVYLTARRSPYFALAYAANDVVLIVLWVLASLHDVSYISVAVCFVMFLFNDLYGFINWRRMQKIQAE